MKQHRFVVLARECASICWWGNIKNKRSTRIRSCLRSRTNGAGEHASSSGKEGGDCLRWMQHSGGVYAACLWGPKLCEENSIKSQQRYLKTKSQFHPFSIFIFHQYTRASGGWRSKLTEKRVCDLSWSCHKGPKQEPAA